MTIRLQQPVICPILVGRSAELTALQDCLVLSKLGLTSRSQIALWTRDKGLVFRKR